MRVVESVAYESLGCAIHVAIVLAGRFEGCLVAFRFSIKGNIAISIAKVDERHTSRVPRSHEVLARDADASASDIDRGRASAVLVNELVGPTHVEGMAWVVPTGFGMLYGQLGEGAYRGQPATAIDVSLHPATADADARVALCAPGIRHRRDIDVMCSPFAINEIIRCSLGAVVAAEATSVNAVPDGAALDGDGGILGEGAQLASAKHAAFDDGGFALRLTDIHIRFLHLGQIRPVRVGGRAVQLG